LLIADFRLTIENEDASRLRFFILNGTAAQMPRLFALIVTNELGKGPNDKR